MPFFEHHEPESAETSLALNHQGEGLLASGPLALSLRVAPSWMRSTFQETSKSSHTSPPFRVVDQTGKIDGQGRMGARYGWREDDKYGARVIFMAHQTESLISQATNKFTDLINKEGYAFRTSTKAIEEYIEARLRFLGRCTGTSFRSLAKELSRDYVGQGNAYLLKVYEKDRPIVVAGRRLKSAVEIHGDADRGVISGLLRMDPRTVRPRYDKRSGRHNGWIQKAPVGTQYKDKTFALDEVVHFAYQRPAGDVLGISMHRPVLDDIRALRDQEEYAIKLFEKMLFPIIHHSVPPRGDDLYGTAEDVDQAAYGYTGLSPDGILITPPGHEIKMIGAAGEALNPVPQLDYMMNRIFMGVGLSATIMGVESSAAGTSDVLTTQMHDRVKSFQQDLEEVFNLHLFYELLVEGGYDPSKKDQHCCLEYNEIEHEARIRLENHADNMFTTGLWTEDEARAVSLKNPLTAAERKKKQIYTDQIPVMEAEAKINTASTKETADQGHGHDKALATHNHKLSKDAASHEAGLNKDLAQHTHTLTKDALAHDAKVQKDLVGSGVQPNAKQQITLARIQSQTAAAKASAPKPAVRKSSSNKTANGGRASVVSKNNPSNQHGSRGAARASSTPAAGHASKRRAKSSSISRSVKGK